MVIDIHTHADQSLNCDISLKHYETAYRDREIGFVITEHNHLRMWDAPDRPLFCGIEVLNDYGDFLIFGAPSDCIEIRQNMNELISYVHENEGAIVSAHPFAQNSLFTLCERDHALDIARELDAIETLNGIVKPKTNGLADRLATELGKPKTGGSDAHELSQLLHAGTEFEIDIIDIGGIAAAIRQGRCRPVSL